MMDMCPSYDGLIIIQTNNKARPEILVQMKSVVNTRDAIDP